MSHFSQYYDYYLNSFTTKKMQISARTEVFDLELNVDKTLIVEEIYNNISIEDCISKIIRDETIDWIVNSDYSLPIDAGARLHSINDSQLIGFLSSCGIGTFSSSEWNGIFDNPGFAALLPYTKSCILWCNFSLEDYLIPRIGFDVNEYIIYMSANLESKRRQYLALLEIGSDIDLNEVLDKYSQVSEHVD